MTFQYDRFLHRPMSFSVHWKHMLPRRALQASPDCQGLDDTQKVKNLLPKIIDMFSQDVLFLFLFYGRSSWVILSKLADSYTHSLQLQIPCPTRLYRAIHISHLVRVLRKMRVSHSTTKLTFLRRQFTDHVFSLEEDLGVLATTS